MLVSYHGISLSLIHILIGPYAPQEVKDAWMEAAKEVNANGMGIKKNGMLSHISQMMVQRLNKQKKGCLLYTSRCV